MGEVPTGHVYTPLDVVAGSTECTVVDGDLIVARASGWVELDHGRAELTASWGCADGRPGRRPPDLRRGVLPGVHQLIAQRIVLAVRPFVEQARRTNSDPSLDACLAYVAQSLGRPLDAQEERLAEVAFDQEVAS